MSALREQYKEAKLRKLPTEVWLFDWYNFSPAVGQLKRVRLTFDINRITDLKRRAEVADAYLSNLNEALRSGYNYWIHEAGEADSTQPEPAAAIPVPAMLAAPSPNLAAQPVISVSAALQRVLKKRILGRAPRTAQTYESYHRTFTEWLTANGMELLPVTDFTAEIWEDFLFYKSSRGHGNSNLNDYTSHFKMCFSDLRKKAKLIKENPLEEIELLPEAESSLFQPLTEDEIKVIVPALIAYNPRFYLFTRFIPYQFIRPYHIARLQASQIAYSKEYIAVSGATTKNKKNTRKQLLQPIKDMLQEMGYDKVPGTYYLFSNTRFEPGTQLYPSLSNRAAEIWKEIVIDGLGINKKMYALKHSAAQYYVNENDAPDMLYLQQQLEHHSVAQTEVYLQGKIYKKVDQGKTKMLDY